MHVRTYTTDANKRGPCIKKSFTSLFHIVSGLIDYVMGVNQYTVQVPRMPFHIELLLLGPVKRTLSLRLCKQHITLLGRYTDIVQITLHVVLIRTILL